MCQCVACSVAPPGARADTPSWFHISPCTATTTLNPLKTTSVSGSPAGAGAQSSATSPSAAASASAAGTPGSAGRPLSRAVVLASREDRSKNTLKGYLRKKSSKGAWQKRWFEASNHYLTYYKVGVCMCVCVGERGRQGVTVMLTRGWPTCSLGGDTQHTQSLESNRILACIDLAKVGDVKMAPNAAADGPPFHFSIQLDERVYMMRVTQLQ